MTAYGYIRKSVIHDASRMLSPETQEAAIRALAARNGDEDVTILSDLDVSGKKDRTRRRGWNDLLTAVETGEATAVYAYSLSRFARSVSQLSTFFDLCKDKKVAIRVERDHIDTGTASGELVANVLASLAQFESSVASERTKDALAEKRRRDPTWKAGNLEYGALPGEDTKQVIKAFRDARSFDGAARLLNAREVPSRLKDAVWHGTTVAAIVKRERPDLLIGKLVTGGTKSTGSRLLVGRGAKAGTQKYRFARLLACSLDGHYLTPSRDSRTGDLRYYCHRAKVVAHPRGWVYEPKVLPLIAAEAEHAAVLIKRATIGRAEDEATLTALAQKRARILDMAQDGMIEKDDAQRRLAEVAEAESHLAARRAILRITVPPDIEHGDAGVVNHYLRRLLDRVTVDMSEPARRGPSHWNPLLTFEWRDPSLRLEAIGEDDESQLPA